ncbi:hypothetical protein INS49_001438 [Diaporthe citri]|uniref:uncharacterized protein n=1 Tax=Diaporthe citri TaxID=83186 RepID=UPI001C7F1FE6|nr:uncharacterized protein INS49_001438 [Diaporthe citri]KAG6367252.1 hypothetical protein INS49_001438 [Diaporthe citri]
MAQAEAHDAFTQEVHRLRAIYQKQRDTTNLVPPAGRIAFDIAVDVIDGITYHTYWYEIEGDSNDLQERYHVVRLADIPGTLSGDILRLKHNLPVLNTDHAYDIVGDEVRQLQAAPPLPDDRDDAEDTSEMLAVLPVVEVDPAIHFAKKGKYASEIRNLLACQGGSCPGVPKSDHVIQLLGKSRAAELVFNKFTPRYVFGQVYPLATYKTWILQVIDGLRCLHSVEIVHRDLRIDNLVVAESSRLVIIDLESRWGNRLAPEVSRRPILDAGWTEKSDIYDLGYLVKEMIYGNVAITNLVDWPVPPPLQAIVEACTRVSPDDRPTLDELAAMVNGIVENTQNP